MIPTNGHYSLFMIIYFYQRQLISLKIRNANQWSLINIISHWSLSKVKHLYQWSFISVYDHWSLSMVIDQWLLIFNYDHWYRLFIFINHHRYNSINCQWSLRSISAIDYWNLSAVLDIYLWSLTPMNDNWFVWVIIVLHQWSLNS